MQNIAAGQEGSAAAVAAVKRAAELHAQGSTTSADVERLTLLACLRFEERASHICGAARGAAPASVSELAATLARFGGAARREEDLFGGGLLGGVRRMMGDGGEGGSVFMQHSPLLAKQLEAVADGKLDAKKYPVGALPFRRHRSLAGTGDADHPDHACLRPLWSLVLVTAVETYYFCRHSCILSDGIDK